MSTQPTGGDMQGMLPAVAAAGGLRGPDDEDRTTASDGAAVGEADRQADLERSGAATDDDDAVSAPGSALLSEDLGVANPGSDGGMPVGADDAEADRQRTTGD
jgi:hypothetical protein